MPDTDLTNDELTTSIALGIGTWGMFGTQAALMPELFGSRHRYMGVSIAREASAVIAGGIAPMIGAGIIALVVASHDGDASTGIGAWLPIACYLTLHGVTKCLVIEWDRLFMGLSDVKQGNRNQSWMHSCTAQG